MHSIDGFDRCLRLYVRIGLHQPSFFQVDEFLLKLISNWKKWTCDIYVINSNFLQIVEIITVIEPTVMLWSPPMLITILRCNRGPVLDCPVIRLLTSKVLIKENFRSKTCYIKAFFTVVLISKEEWDLVIWWRKFNAHALIQMIWVFSYKQSRLNPEN